MTFFYHFKNNDENVVTNKILMIKKMTIGRIKAKTIFEWLLFFFFFIQIFKKKNSWHSTENLVINENNFEKLLYEGFFLA